MNTKENYDKFIDKYGDLYKKANISKLAHQVIVATDEQRIQNFCENEEINVLMKYLAIIPARKWSKNLNNKNLRKFNKESSMIPEINLTKFKNYKIPSP